MTVPETSVFRIGTRGSALALWQARAVQAMLAAHVPRQAFELEIIRPEGDIDKHSSLTAIGGRGVFTSALQVQLLDGRIDLAVHSLKDLPSLSPHGLGIAAIPQREDPRDALVSRHRVPLRDLPPNPVIGTSSRRRAVQVLAIRPDAQIRDLRGNIDTRLKKGLSEDYDAVILALAGLRRMGWGQDLALPMDVNDFVPAPGQGALAIETRTAPDPASDLVSSLDDADIRLAVATERAFLRGVGGGCTTPIGAHAAVERLHGRRVVRFWGMLASDDHTRLERVYEEFPADRAEAHAFDVAAHLMHVVAPKWRGTGELNPFAGATVLVTGSDVQAGPLAREFAEHGARAVRMPTIEIEPVEDLTPVRDALASPHEWLVLTSANAVPTLVAALEGRSPRARIATVGARTTRALVSAGIPVALEGPGPGATELVEIMAREGLQGARVLCLLSDRARPTLTDGLGEAGATVEVVTAYRTVAASDVDEDTRALIRHGGISAVTFASPSAVEGFRTLAGADLPAMSGAAFFSVGPTTSQALREAGLPVHGEAPTQDPAGFIDAFRAFFQHQATPSISGGHDDD